MDRQLESEDCMQTEGANVCLSQTASFKPRDNNELRPDNTGSASNSEATEHTEIFSDGASPTIQPLSTASGQGIVTISNPKNSERNLHLPLRITSTPMTNIPSLHVDSSQCRPSISSSNESLQLAQEAKRDTLEVDYQQSKRKFKQSPVKEKSDDSDSLGYNDERSEEAEKPRQKKSNLLKLLGRKTPSKSREMSQKEFAAKGSRSQSRSPSRSPSPNKSKSPKSSKEKASKKSLSPSDGRRSKSPNDVRRARSPVAEFVGKSINALFKKRHDSETEALCAALNSDSDPPKVHVQVSIMEKEKKAVDHWKVGAIPDEFDPVFDVNLSDTTCDSQSTRPSLASVDSNPLPDEADQIEANIDDKMDPFEE